jgi:hypothetical protein
MIKIKDLQYRSLWYKKNFYYLKSGQSLSASTNISANCQETTQIHQEIDDGLRLSDILSDIDIFCQSCRANRKYRQCFSIIESTFKRSISTKAKVDKCIHISNIGFMYDFCFITFDSTYNNS